MSTSDGTKSEEEEKLSTAETAVIDNTSTTKDKAKTTKAEKTTPAKAMSAVEENVARAEATVYQNAMQSDMLQNQWRQIMFQLSMVIFCVSLHQSHSYIGNCIRDIQSFNRHVLQERAQEQQRQEGEEMAEILSSTLPAFSGYDAFVVISKDAFVYLVALAMTISLCFFLFKTEPMSDFTSRYYTFANLCVPILMTLHFSPYYFDKLSEEQRAQQSALLGGGGGGGGCIDPSLAEVGLEPHERTLRFPVVLVFHVLVTVCYWFMNNQTKIHERNIRTVRRLRHDLTVAQEKQQRDNSAGNKKQKK